MFEFYKKLSLSLKQALINQSGLILSLFFLFLPHFGIWLMVAFDGLLLIGVELGFSVFRRSCRDLLQSYHTFWFQFLDPRQNFSLPCVSYTIDNGWLRLFIYENDPYEFLIEMHDWKFSLQDFAIETLYDEDLNLSYVSPTIALFVKYESTDLKYMHCLGINVHKQGTIGDDTHI
jgi:hypothetical protein